MDSRRLPADVLALKARERRIAWIRWAGVAFALLQVTLEDPSVRAAGYGIAGALAVATLFVLRVNARTSSLAAQHALAGASLALDVAALLAFSYLYAFQPHGSNWVVLYLAPLEAALRFGLRGALATAAAVSLLYIPRELYREIAFGFPFSVPSATFRLGVLWVVAAVAGSIGEQLASERDEARRLAADLERRVEDRTQALRATERRFQALIEHSADGTVLCSGDGVVQYASPAGTRISGYSPEEQVGLSIFTRIHPDEQTRARERFLAVLRTPGATATGLFRRQRKDGSWYWAEVSATNLLHEPTVGAIVVNYRDVTARRQAEQEVMEVNARLRHALDAVSASEETIRQQAERLRLVNEFARAASATLDPESIFTLATAQVTALLGATRCSIARSEPGAGLGAEPESAGTLRVIATSASPEAATPDAGLSTAQAGEVGNAGAGSEAAPVGSEPATAPRRSSGARPTTAIPIWIEGAVWGQLEVEFAQPDHDTPERAALLEAIAGHLSLAIKNARLYTDLRAAHEELQRTQEQVVQQERLRALGQMASGIAHDLNNALSPVVGFSELLLLPASQRDPQTVAQYLQLIHTGAQDAASVVGRLREFYRHRDQDEVLAAVSLAPLVRQVVALTEPKWKDQAQAAGGTVRVETDLQPTPPVSGSETELREALTNLVFNAVDAMPDGGTVTLRSREEDGYAVLEVADTGVGMTPQVRRRCLEPFFTTKGERGTGLGLAMVHGVVRRHRATLRIASAVGKGTTISIRIPLAPPPSEVPPAAPEPETPVAARPLRVLVVDDDHMVRAVTAAYLHADGHTVHEAPGGAEALEALHEGTFDCVLTDRAMPGVSGDQLALAVKQRWPDLPVVLVTGFGDLMVAAGERPKGVDAVLGKPLNRAALRAVLDRMK